jgi:hypothetical protein
LSPEKTTEPYPIQTERSALFVELLGQRRRDGTMITKSRVEIDRMAEDLIDQALGRSKRIAFIFRGDPNLNMLAERRDLKLIELGNCEEPAPAPGGLMLHWLGGIVKPDPPPNPLSAGERKAMTWHIFELEPLSPPSAPPASVAGAANR